MWVLIYTSWCPGRGNDQEEGRQPLPMRVDTGSCRVGPSSAGLTWCPRAPLTPGLAATSSSRASMSIDDRWRNGVIRTALGVADTPDHPLGEQGLERAGDQIPEEGHSVCSIFVDLLVEPIPCDHLEFNPCCQLCPRFIWTFIQTNKMSAVVAFLCNHLYDIPPGPL